MPPGASPESLATARYYSAHTPESRWLSPLTDMTAGVCLGAAARRADIAKEAGKRVFGRRLLAVCAEHAAGLKHGILLHLRIHR